ncbi:MAG: hypothetical protein JWN99_2249 [Ilumatobacteraceae bacterium]|nr:hypothetical protein [Ilumatobacteraceae bacterium]
MTDIERLATTASDGMRTTLGRLGNLAATIILITVVVSAATFATGAWVFDNSVGWFVVGGVLCAIPVIAAVRAWLLVRTTVKSSPTLVTELRTFLPTSQTASGALIDHDSGVALGMQAKSFRQMRIELNERRKELPALFAGVRAITTVPGLAAIAFFGLVLVGALGTILLIGGLL